VYGPISDKQRDALASIKRSAQQLLSLVDDLLTLTRAESDKLVPRVSETAIRPLVDQVVASAGWMAGTKRLTLTADVGDDVPAVASDPRLLAHVLVNLIANAIKFTPEDGAITVRARRAGGGVEIAVTDTGVGIPADQLATIFEPFVQGEGGDERRFGGVGLGLALVRRLCGVLGADVAVASERGKGSTFTIRVPVEWTRPLPAQAGAQDQARN
jgi:signal transduction histidine kinase